MDTTTVLMIDTIFGPVPRGDFGIALFIVTFVIFIGGVWYYTTHKPKWDLERKYGVRIPMKEYIHADLNDELDEYIAQLTETKK